MIQAKLFFIILGLLLFYFVFRIKYTFQLRVIEKIVLLILFIVGFSIIINPSLLDKAAIILNVDRGRDLLFYIYIMLSTWGLIRSHIRINYQSSRLKKLISELALVSSNLNNNKKELKDETKDLQ